ncbi:MAG: NAD(P)-dependent alcohol dehydrogenase [Saprospirales bacterium]|nr:MAG: NAD(P)-dependent alcohol dehydrogenase [Saprospirales bacterium]
MKSAIIAKFGGADSIKMVEEPLPSIKGSQVLIKVGYAGVNPLDWKVRSGSMKMVTGKKLPQKPGYECSGLVSEIGPAVKDLIPGDRVIGYTGLKGGAYAEYVALPERDCARVPETIDLKVAAGVPICGLTAYQCLTQRGKIAKGDEILIVGAAGGVGSFATQIARILGARTTAVCSSANVQYVKDLGADAVIDYTTEDVYSCGLSFNLIFDAVNAHKWSEIKKLLKPNGIYVNTIPGPVEFIRQIFTGLLPGKKFKTFLMKSDRGQISWILEKMAAGEIRLNVDEVFPFQEVAEAISANEKMRTRGKIIVEVDPSIN